MKIELTIPINEMFIFLRNKGYEVKSYMWSYTDDTFPGGTSYHEKWTFTATKPGENQSEKNIYTEVFEKEVLKVFKKETFLI